MRSVDSNGVLERSCFTLVLLFVSGQMIAEPLGRLQANQTYTRGLRIADKAAVQRPLGSDHSDGLRMPEVLEIRAVSGDSSAAVQSVWLTSQHEDVFTGLTPQVDFSAPRTATSQAERDTDKVPESSTLFLLGLGLVGLSQIPVRKFAKKLADRRESLMPRTDGIPLESKPSLAIPRTLPATAENHLEA